MRVPPKYLILVLDYKFWVQKKAESLLIHNELLPNALILVYKSLIGSAPSYLQDLFSYKTWGHTLALSVPAVNSLYGKRAFSYIGPKLWNTLPKDLKECATIANFKSMLKTYLFKQSDHEIVELFNI